LVLEIRIVWPAFLSIAGTAILMGYAIAVLGFLSLARPVYDQQLNFSEALPYLAIGLSGLAGAGLSLYRASQWLRRAAGLVPDVVREPDDFLGTEL
jgi:hypothetical protein